MAELMKQPLSDIHPWNTIDSSCPQGLIHAFKKSVSDDNRWFLKVLMGLTTGRKTATKILPVCHKKIDSFNRKGKKLTVSRKVATILKRPFVYAKHQYCMEDNALTAHKCFNV